MISNFKKPNVKGPRFRNQSLGLLNNDIYSEFKELKPAYANIDNNKLKKIIMLYNEALWKAVIAHRDGVELPESLGYIFIGTCPPAKSVNIDYSLSKEYGKVLQNKNWDTDGNIGKIFYTNFSTKYKFRNRDLWGFVACRDFKRCVSKEYPKDWTKYLKMKNKFRIAQLFLKSTDKENLDEYDEFEN